MNYSELHCLTNFSFLRSASHAHELVERAKNLGYSALAITDECSLAGVVKAQLAAEQFDMPIIIGAEFFIENYQLIALVMNRTGYSELSALITLARRRSNKGEYHLHWRDLEHNLRNNLLIWKPQRGHPHNEKIAASLQQGFGDRLWIGYSNLLRGDEHEHFLHCWKLGERWHIPLVACGNIAMHTRDRRMLLDAVTAIYHNTSIDKLGTLRDSNAERYLRERDILDTLYPPTLLQETQHLTARCTFSLRELKYQYPREVVPSTMTAATYLQHQVMLGAQRRWPQGIPSAMQHTIDRELALIHELHYEYYFLTVFDIVEYARSRGILCQGRGSAANSVVCYCLGITEVSPEQTSLLFERFISKERGEPPDIDVDFEHERREEVIQYIYKKYGRERAALAATVICYRTRSAIRDIGKALGFDPLFVDQLAKSMAWWDTKHELLAHFEQLGCAINARTVELFFHLVQELRDFPRHLSQHVGGFVLNDAPLSTLVPVENASMPERTIIQWDKEDLEALGLMKVDVLALGMLTAIRKALQLIPASERPACMADIPHGDADTYAMLQRADSVGVFQVESRAQMSMLPRLRPQNYYDLVVQVAIVRPGPIQGDMVHPYLRRRAGIEAVEKDLRPEIWAITERTLGIPIFQEQVIKIAMVAADFTGGEADQLRRAMASWGKNGNLLQFREKLIERMTAPEKNYPIEFVERIFNQMKGFGAYGFPESHAASFALLVYVSAWLKCHHPAEFYCGLLNSQPMGFYSSSQLIQDAKRHHIEVRPVDVNDSEWHHTLENTVSGARALRLGFRLIKNFGEDAARRLLQARQQRLFADIGDLQHRATLSRLHLRSLIAADALHRLSGHRHQSHWQASAIAPPLALSGTKKNYGAYDYNDGILLSAPSEIQEIRADYNSTSLTLKKHPLQWLREQHDLFRQCKKSIDLKDLTPHRFVRVAGIVTGRQRPGTETGIIFVTLEDETGNSNVIVREDVQLRCREALLSASILLVKGIVEMNQSVIHIVAGELIDCSEYLYDVELVSRDFH
ncbi:MAG: error-prone DNA polymerase [Spongiibacteraceae bacterium]